MDSDRWRSDIVEAYFDNLSNDTALQRRDSNQPQQQQLLSAPPLEKTDSLQWSPMSSGLVTPQDSIGYWSAATPDRRQSGRFSGESALYGGQSNRWSLGTQLSNVSFAECTFLSIRVFLIVVPKPEDSSEEEKDLDWNTVETSEALFDEEDEDEIEEADTLFHPDDEIIVDTKDAGFVKRVFPSNTRI
jgi:hypothetical protein